MKNLIILGVYSKKYKNFIVAFELYWIISVFVKQELYAYFLWEYLLQIHIKCDGYVYVMSVLLAIIPWIMSALLDCSVIATGLHFENLRILISGNDRFVIQLKLIFDIRLYILSIKSLYKMFLKNYTIFRIFC